MAKDFTNTQTGGSGSTSQTGDEPVKSTSVDNAPVKKVSLEKTAEPNNDNVKPVVSNEGEPEKKKTEGSIDPIPLKSEDVATVPTEEESLDLQEETPLVAPLVSDAQEEKVNYNNFIIPENEDSEEREYSSSEVSFFIPENEVESPIQEEEEPVKPKKTNIKVDSLNEAKELFNNGYRPSVNGSIDQNEDIESLSNLFNSNGANGVEMVLNEDSEILSYPGRKTQYIIKDGSWHERESSSDDWKKITQRGRVFGLNDYHKKNVSIPKSNYKPLKGGVEMQGMQVYGYPARPGTAYTIQDGSWYRMSQGDDDWEFISESSNINALNRYHGTKIETQEHKESSSATSSPAIQKAYEKGELNSLGGESLNSQINRAKDNYGRIKPRKLENIEKVGDILQARGFSLEKTEASVGTDSREAAITMYGTNVEALFNAPDRPSDIIGSRVWDEKHGPSLPPNRDVLSDSEDKYNVASEKMKSKLLELESQGYSEGYDNYDLLKSELELEVSKAKSELDQESNNYNTSLESFTNRSAYMQSDQYEIDKKNSPEYKKARIQERMSYGMYDPTAAEKMQKDNEEMRIVENQIETNRLKNFTQTNLELWASNSSLTEDQLSQLKMYQNQAKGVVSLSEIAPGLFGSASASNIYEIENFMNTTVEINNRLAEAQNRGMDLTDVLIENKKLLINSNEGVVTEEVENVFNSTLEMRDFVSDYIDSGKVSIDPLSGAYSISDNVSSSEKEYIDNQLSELISNYNVAKNQIYSNNRKLIYAKKGKVKSLEAAISKAELDLRSGESVSNTSINSQIENYKNQIRDVNNDIRELRGGENTVFLSDPDAISLDASMTSTTSARQILQSIPEGISPKQRFDVFYESLLKKNESLAKKNSISSDYWDRLGEKTRDVLDWEYLGASLSPEEVEYYKNSATLRKLMPLYLNNDWGATSESATFWESFYNSFIKTFAPQTADAYGFFNETDAIVTQIQTAAQLGFTDEDMASGMTYDQMKDRMDVLWYGSEGVGSMVGTSSAIMLSLAMSVGSTTGVVKAGKGVARLINRYEKLDKVADAVKDFKRIEEAYSKTMNATKTGKFFYQSINQGIQLEVAGMLFNQDEELNFMSGMGGAMAGKLFEGVFKKMPPSKVVEWVGGFFGGNTDKAVSVLKRLGKETRGLRAANYRGLGEMPEEFAQELIGIYRDELGNRGFWDVVNERYFDGEEGFSNLGKLLISSYVMGAGMGTVMTTTQQDIIDTLTPSEMEAVEKVMKDGISDMAIANANSDIAAGRIVDNYEAVENKEKLVNDEVSDVNIDESNDIQEESDIDSEEIVTHNGKEGVWKKMPGSGTPYFEEKRGEIDTEVDVEVESANIENEGVESKTPLSDKIRTLKVGDSMKGVAASTLIPTKVWDTAVEGLAITVETVEKAVQNVRNSDWYKDLRKNNPEQADKVDVDLDKVSSGVIETEIKQDVNESSKDKYQQLKSKISTFKKGHIKGMSEGKKLTKDEKKAKNDEILEVQNDLIGYARENLPKKSYNQSEITTLMNKVKNARTPKGLEKALDAIDKKMDDFQEEVRVSTADRIIKSFVNPLTKKRGDKKVSKISVESRDKLKSLSEEIDIDSIKDMNQEELTGLELKMDSIIDEGAEFVKEKEYQKREERRIERAVPFQELAKQNKAPIIQKEGKKAIDDFFLSKQGSVVYDGQLFTGKAAFEEYLDKKGVSYESIGSVDVIQSRGTSKDASRKYQDSIDLYNKTKNTEKEAGFKAYVKRGAKKLSKTPVLRVQEAGKTLESRMMDIYKGSKELRDWSKKNILESTNKSYVDRDNGRLEKLDVLRNEMQGIFGKQVLTGIPKNWNNDSGVSIYGKDSAHNLTNGQAVNVFMMLTSEPSTIYKVGDDYYSSKSQAESKSKDSGINLEEFSSKYNPQVLIQISEDQSLLSGLDKASEIESFIEKNENLQNASNLFKEKYKEYRGDYEQTFVDLYDQKFKEGDYVPMTRSMDSELDTDLLSSNYTSASSAVSSHLKQRYNNSNVTFDFSTDAYSKILDYVKTMEHAKHFMPVADSMRNLMNDATKAQIIEKIGARNTFELKKHMDRILSDGRSTPLANDAFTRMAQYTVVTTLAGKLASIPKQLTSATHYLGAGLDDGVGTSDILLQSYKLPFAVASGVSGSKKAGSVVLSKGESEVISEMFNDAFIRNRVTGKDIDTETRSLANDLMSSKGRNISKILTRAAMSPTILGDIGGVLTGGIPFTLATYNNNLSNKGMTHEEAMSDAIYKFVGKSNKTQQSQRDDIISNAQRDPAYRLFLTYTTSQVAAMAELIKAAKILTDFKGGYSSKEYVNAGRKFGYYMVANSVFQVVASGALGMYLMDDDDDEREAELKKTALYNTIMDTASSNLQGFGITGKALDWWMNSLRGRDVFNNIPVIDRMYTATEVAGEYTDTFMDAVSLYAEGEITAEEMFGTMYWDVGEKTENKAMKLIGVKNFMDTWESWGQYSEAEEGSKMTWWDAVMSRQMNKEGDIYKTGGERKDGLYMKILGSEESEDEKSSGKPAKSDFSNVFDNSSSGFNSDSGMFSGSFNSKKSKSKKKTDKDSDEDETPKKKRSKDEILERIKSERASKKKDVDSTPVVDKQNESENEVVSDEKSSYNHKEELDLAYEKIFGEKPSDTMTESEITESILSGKKP